MILLRVVGIPESMAFGFHIGMVAAIRSCLKALFVMLNGVKYQVISEGDSSLCFE